MQSVQIGPADIVSTVSSAHSAWGWLNGLSGVKTLLDYGDKVLRIGGKSQGTDILDINPRLSPIGCIVLTCDGQFYVSDDDVGQSFSGDIRAQWVGLTICALAHECGGSTAVELYMKCLATKLFEQSLMRDQIHGQLVEHLERVLNEGAARGLQQRFTTAIENKRIPTGNGKKLRQLVDADDGSEFGLVGGLLSWIASRNREPYLTRSSLVARVATCLKEIGYNIGHIRTWGGEGTRPKDDKAVVLVLGGTVDTDERRISDDELPNDIQIYHYRISTVGALFCTALSKQSNVRPESLQARFMSVHEYITDHLQFVWRSGYTNKTVGSNTGQINACPVWKKYEGKSLTSTAFRIAASLFPTASEWLAPCYVPISDEDHLAAITNPEERSAIGWKQQLSPAIIDFRIITASIIMSVASRLAPEGFDSMRHAIGLDLDTPDWLTSISSSLDKHLYQAPSHHSPAVSSGVPFWKAVQIVAVIHAAIGGGQVDQDADVDIRRIIGWRSGVYSVIPSIILEMAPTERAIGIRCLDKFWANAIVRSQGSIHTQDNTLMYGRPFKPDDLEGISQGVESQMSLVNTVGECHLGPAVTRPPDRQLYLSLEKPPRLPDHDICFCGRVNGDSVGMVSILSVIQTLIVSLDESEQCTGHAKTDSETVYNVQTSNWCEHKNQKPCWEGMPTVVSALEHPLWTLFLAGHSGWGLNGRISFGCFTCALKEQDKHSFIVGYK